MSDKKNEDMNDITAERYLPQPRRRAHILFAIACCVILSLFVAGFFQSNASIKSLETIKSQVEHMRIVDQLMIELVNAETGVRGFIITGDHDFLAPYETAITQINTYLAETQSFAANNPDIEINMDRLNQLIFEQEDLFVSLVNEKDDNNDISMREMIDSKTKFDQIRTYVSHLKAELDTLSIRYYAQVQNSQTITRWAIFALCLAALFFLIWLFANLQKQNRLKNSLAEVLANENEKLETQVARRTQQLSRLAAKITRVSEVEKQRLARELHDDMGASLTAAKMDASWIEKNLTDENNPTSTKRTARLINSLDHAISLKRRLTSDLLPPLLSQLGLHEALRSLADDLKHDTDIHVSIKLPDDEPKFDKDTALSLFRITQEAMTNIRKYSEANNVELSVSVDEFNHTLRIIDDGIGFDRSTVSEERFGLISMQHRAGLSNAKFFLKSRLGEGTRIKVITPIIT